MRVMRSGPTASTMARATVVLPEPVPPATPRTQGLIRESVSRGWSRGSVSTMAGDCSSFRREAFFGSALAAGAVVGAAAGLDDPPHGAAAGEARLPLAVIGRQGHLEVAAAPLAVGEVVEGGPSLGDGLAQHRDRRGGDAVPARRRDPPHRARRVDAGPVE